MVKRWTIQLHSVPSCSRIGKGFGGEGTPFGSWATSLRQRSSASDQKEPICRTSACSVESLLRMFEGVLIVTQIVDLTPSMRLAEAAARPIIKLVSSHLLKICMRS
jgi:hypothetical protein